MKLQVIYMFFLVAVLGSVAYGQSSPQDCIGAIPVCNSVINNPNAIIGSGNVPNEINSTSSCIGGGEVNSIWYALTIQTDGDLGFLLNPITPTDYDWAVFNLTNSTCSDIFTDPTILVSCNFAPVTTATGPNGNNAPGIGFNPMIPVLAGETYIVFINNYGNSTSGFNLDFTMSTAQIFDNNAPTVLGLAAPLACNANSFTLELSEPISCASLTNNMFTVSGPTGNIPVNSVSCAGGGMYSNQLIISLGANLTESGVYTVTLANGNMSDLCGNALTPGTAIPTNFNFAGITFSNPITNPSLCYSPTGSASVTVNGGTNPLTFNWTPAGGPNASTWNNINGGNYSLTITDANGCTNTQDFVVPTLYDFTINTTQTPDTCNKGNGAANINVAGTSGPFNVVWEHDGSLTNQVFNLSGDSTYIVSVTDVNGCVLSDTLTIINVSNDSLLANFNFLQDTVDILLPIGQAINASQNYQSFLWLLPAPNASDSINQSPVFRLEDGGLFPVSIIAIDQNGCRDTATKEIYVAPDIYYYIPNSFTPNGNGVNDVWRPQGIGFNRKKFFVRIYNRWGELVYTTADPNEGWDGTDLKGRACPSDSYVYRITMEGLELEDYGDFKGFVNLIR